MWGSDDEPSTCVAASRVDAPGECEYGEVCRNDADCKLLGTRCDQLCRHPRPKNAKVKCYGVSCSGDTPFCCLAEDGTPQLRLHDDRMRATVITPDAER